MTSTVSEGPHVPPVSVDDGYDAYRPEEDDPRNTSVASRRDNGYDTYMPKHDVHQEHVGDGTLSPGLAENVEELYKVHWFRYGPEEVQLEPR